MSEVSGPAAAKTRDTASSERAPTDLVEPTTHELVAAAIRVARGAGLSWVHINQVLGDARSVRTDHPASRVDLNARRVRDPR